MKFIFTTGIGLQISKFQLERKIPGIQKFIQNPKRYYSNNIFNDYCYATWKL